MIAAIRTLAAVVAAFTLLGGTAGAQTVVPVMVNGDAANRLDIAFFGDGYTADDMAKFRADVDATLQGMLAQEPFREYGRFLNARRIEIASPEAGASHPSQGIVRTTAFGASYDCGGIPRLICLDTGKVLSAAQKALPANSRDLIIVLVNDPRYGGAGGTVTVASMHTLSVELMLHELGHTFGLLGDEYGVSPLAGCGGTLEPTGVNVTRETDATRIKWRHWIAPTTPIPTTNTTDGVPGLFTGAMFCDSGFYRPVYNSKMRTLGAGWWQVNSEQLIRRIYALVDPIDSVSPPASGVVTLAAGESRTFSVATPEPATHTLSSGWWVDGQLKSTARDYVVSANHLSKGAHTLQVVVTDAADAVRSDPQGLLSSQAAWSLNAADKSLDFAINADRQTIALTRGQSGTVGLTVMPVEERLASDVTLTCGGLPDSAQCQLSPTSIPAGSTSTTSVLTITTTASSARGLPSGNGTISALGVAWLLTAPAFLSRGTARRAGRRRALVALGFVAALTLLTQACGGGEASTGGGVTPPTPVPKPGTPPGTPPGTYTVVVTAISGTFSHTMAIAVTVQ